MSLENRDASFEPLIQKNTEFVFVPTPHGAKKARIIEAIELADGSGKQYKLDFGYLHHDSVPNFAEDLYYSRESFFTEDDLLYFMELEDIGTLLCRPEVHSDDYDIYLPKPELPTEEFYVNPLVDFALQWSSFQREVQANHDDTSSQ